MRRETKESKRKKLIECGSMRVYLQTQHPDLEEFIKNLGWQNASLICVDIYDCHYGDFPTLRELDEAYGYGASAKWVVPQLHNLSEYSGCKNILSQMQYVELAQNISNYYHYLKVSELMLYFSRFKNGRYGNFYGRIDPIVITENLRKEFLRERHIYIGEVDRLMHLKKEKESKEEGCISYAEYCRRHGKPVPENLERTTSVISQILNKFKINKNNE